jgi:hypothetical protein
MNAGELNEFVMKGTLNLRRLSFDLTDVVKLHADFF